MLKAAIRTVYCSALKCNLILNKFYWLLLLGLVANFHGKTASAQGESIAINENNIKQSITLRGVSGGKIAALDITQTKNTATGYCDGFASEQPNHILSLSTFFDYLRLEVQSSADTTILVKGVGGVWCNDDAESANPVIEGQWQQGDYQVWVGSYKANTSDSYQIKITGR